MLSISTDYAKDHGNPEPYLREIAETGFSHIHWLHHWSGDFIYSSYEIEQIGRWLEEYNLILSDLHATEGKEKFWLANEEYIRQSGVALAQNRLEMTAVLGGDAIVLHLPSEPDDETNAQYWRQVHRSLDDLLPLVQKSGVRIALENNFRTSNYAPLTKILAEYSSDEIGICYDTGHGNIIDGGLDFLEGVKDRLLVLHLNDNDGVGDLHKLLFSGTVEWERIAGIIATSAYNKPLNMEVSMRNMGIADTRVFLDQAMMTCTQFVKMVEAVKSES